MVNSLRKVDFSHPSTGHYTQYLATFGGISAVSLARSHHILHMKVFTGFKKHVKCSGGSFSFLPFSATFAGLNRLKPASGKKHFAGKNANPAARTSQRNVPALILCHCSVVSI